MSQAGAPIFVVAITGASGAGIGIRVLELLRDIQQYEVHLVVTSSGRLTIAQETDWQLRDVQALADVVHTDSQIGARIASGSAPVAGMVVTPCSINTLSRIAHGITDSLVSRAADVCLKEGRPLVLLVRESPVHSGHLASMKALSDLGATIALPVPAFYKRHTSVSQVVDDIARRTLTRAGVPSIEGESWQGLPPESPAAAEGVRNSG